jgi:hypothetical protein
VKHLCRVLLIRFVWLLVASIETCVNCTISVKKLVTR